MTNSRGADSLKDKAKQLGELASPADLKDVGDAEVFFLMVPWSKVRVVSGSLPDLKGKVLVDVTNHFLDNMELANLEGKASSSIVKGYLPGTKLVKALNHYFEKWVDANPEVENGRRMAFVAGDDQDAKALVSDLLSAFGFQPVDMGNLATGSLPQQAGGPLAGLNIVSFPV
ncbi:NADPH-dependent F420 reductase [Mucilaginibacter aquaedulcis]|uniref:NADPH-dependent F420 reductase n=1 Tax=Mucilaginibacter aquaedulcis TaxID=1187081 RepID=UPI0025B57D8B|nr:NAD(P)-binding domain-containing protein [Mucilaginibacter aquaedulcis]MDN3551566.1 NAD(P)-binding domain-containing protein [Mucilaginibacter aquaedulcis]